MAEIICGKNAVIEGIKSGMTINRVLVAEHIDEHFAGAVLRLCRENKIPVRRLPRHKLNQIAPDNRGIAAEISELSYAELEDILEAAREAGDPPFVILLDGVEDPHNLGAIIRSAYCLGAHGVVIGSHRAAQLNQTVMKTSAGAAALLPVARVSNLNQALETLKANGCWAGAVDMDGKSLWESPLEGGVVLVMGAEGNGVSRLIKSNCDFTVSIPMTRGQIGSLNVSNAAAILMTEVMRRRLNAELK